MSEEEEIHPIFLKDPDEWLQYVYKKVCIVTEDGLEHVGLVYTVDPVSETYALVTLGETIKLEMILGHAVRSVTVLSENTDMYKEQLDNLFRPKSQVSLSEEERQKKQSQLKCWLLKNRLPVEVGGTKGELLTLADALVIHPPYGADDCYSTNEIILGKIQGLIKNMPIDQEQW